MSEMTRREAMKLAAGTSLAVAGVAAAAEHDEDKKAADKPTVKAKVQLEAWVTFGHGVTEVQTASGDPIKPGKLTIDAELYTTGRFKIVEPVSKTKVTFPAEGFGFLTICFAVGSTYMNVFYEKKDANISKWCCVTCPTTGFTACGPGVCISCNGQTLCCGQTAM